MYRQSSVLCQHKRTSFTGDVQAVKDGDRTTGGHLVYRCCDCKQVVLGAFTPVGGTIGNRPPAAAPRPMHWNNTRDNIPREERKAEWRLDR